MKHRQINKRMQQNFPQYFLHIVKLFSDVLKMCLLSLCMFVRHYWYKSALKSF